MQIISGISSVLSANQVFNQNVFYKYTIFVILLQPFVTVL